MLDALKVPQTPEELVRTLSQYRRARVEVTKATNSNNADEVTLAELERQKDNLEQLLREIQENPDEHSSLLIETAETLRALIVNDLDTVQNLNFSISFYHDVRDFIQVCETLDDRDGAWELVAKVATVHLDYFAEVKNEEFKSAHRDILERLVAILKTFNKEFEGSIYTLNMLAEAELLYANFMKFYVEKKVEKREYPEDVVEGIRALVMISYENAMGSALNAVKDVDAENFAEPDDFEVFELLEDVAASYVDWLIEIGEKKAARAICDDIYLRNPSSMIHSQVGLPDPLEQRIRRAVTNQEKRKRAKLHLGTNTQSVLTIKRVEDRTRDSLALLGLDDSHVSKAAELLEGLSYLDPAVARKVSQRTNGGVSLFKPRQFGPIDHLPN